MPSQNIEHQGIVKNISGNKIIVSILTQSACSACHAKGMCNLSEIKEKEIEVFDKSGNFKEGDNVSVFFNQKLGTRAVILGYILPFILMILSLLIINYITGNEDLSGLIAILSLTIYYVILYFTRNKLAKTFKFSIKK
jgi:sigma-E factor negative regulatory protein RseC